MTVQVVNEQQVIREALEILLNHLGPAKAARFLAAVELGKGDYLSIRDQLFAHETVDTLYEKVQEYQISEQEINDE